MRCNLPLMTNCWWFEMFQRPGCFEVFQCTWYFRGLGDLRCFSVLGIIVDLVVWSGLVDFGCFIGLGGLMFIPELDGSVFFNGVGDLWWWFKSQCAVWSGVSQWPGWLGCFSGLDSLSILVDLVVFGVSVNLFVWDVSMNQVAWCLSVDWLG